MWLNPCKLPMEFNLRDFEKQWDSFRPTNQLKICKTKNKHETPNSPIYRTDA